MTKHADNSIPDPSLSERPKPEKPIIRIWVTPMLFKKNGFPSLGTFGQSERKVVIIPLESWTAMCKQNPDLATQQFEVGTQE